MEKKPIKPSVIVVDDDSMMREMLKLILRSADYRVLGEAPSGKNGIALCASQKPDFALLDINMPEIDGFQALEEFHKVSPNTMVIMISAEATMDRVNEAIKRGAAGFVVKPLNAAKVISKIESCLKKKNER